MSLPKEALLGRTVQLVKAKGRPPDPKTAADLAEIPPEYAEIDSEPLRLGVAEFSGEM